MKEVVNATNVVRKVNLYLYEPGIDNTESKLCNIFCLISKLCFFVEHTNEDETSLFCDDNKEISINIPLESAKNKFAMLKQRIQTRDCLPTAVDHAL